MELIGDNISEYESLEKRMNIKLNNLIYNYYLQDAKTFTKKQVIKKKLKQHYSNDKKGYYEYIVYLEN